MAAINPSHLQKIVVKGYRLPVSRHLLWTFPAGSRPREFIADLQDLVPHGEMPDDPATGAVHLAFSYPGLRKLGIPSTKALQEFPSAFMDAPTRALLEDESGGAYWNGISPQNLHCLVSIWAKDENQGQQLAATVRAAAAKAGLLENFAGPGNPGEISGQLLDGGPILHFGYRDGISKLDIGWDDATRVPGQIDFRRVILGYADGTSPSSPNPNSAGDGQEAVRFVRDGTYLAFTLLQQDVAGFNAYLDQQARLLLPADASSTDVAAKVEWLAAKFLGRWRNGQPLVLKPDASSPSATEEDLDKFDYKNDAKGMACPFTAHIRMTNPRDRPIRGVNLPSPVLIRRGMPFGEKLTGPENASTPRGLIGLFMCADLGRDFVKTVRWMNTSNFSDDFKGRERDQDIFAASRMASSSKEFCIPTAEGPVILKGLPAFVHTLGTAFFFVPSMATLRQISEGPVA